MAKKKKKKRKLNELEIRVGRTPNYWQMSPSNQWEEDKARGILDWDGTEKWLDEHGK